MHLLVGTLMRVQSSGKQMFAAPFIFFFYRDQHNQEVVDATKNLFEVVIPDFAGYLDKELGNLVWQNALKDQEYVIEKAYEAHEWGINFRQYGYVRQAAKTQNVKRLILNMGIARVVKDWVRTWMRQTMKEVQTPSDEPFKRVILESFKIVNCKDHEKSELFWKRIIKDKLQKKYICMLTEEEMRDSYDLSQFCDLKTINCIITCLVGLKLRKKAKHHLIEDPESFYLVENDLKAIKSSLRHTSIIHFAEGNYLREKAHEDLEKWKTKGLERHPLEVRRQIDGARKAFMDAHFESPLCPMIASHWGLTIGELALELNDLNEAEIKFESAYKKVTKAADTWKNNFSAPQELLVQFLNMYIEWLRSYRTSSKAHIDRLNQLVKRKEQAEERIKSGTLKTCGDA